MAIFFCNIYILLIYIFRNNTKLINKFGIISITAVAFFSVLRIILPIEFPFSKVIESYKIYPAIVTFFAKTLFRIWNYNVSYIDMISIIWLSISGILFLSFATKYFKFSRKIKQIDFIKDPQSEKIMSQVCTSTSIRKKITIIKSDAIKSPCVIGLMSPTIFLPNIVLKDSELYLILLHEWTHFKNRDSLIKIFVQILRCIFWWNPLIHVFFRELDQLLEIRCDQKVTHDFSKNQIKEYLNTLLLVLQKTLENGSKTPFFLVGENYFISERNNNMTQRFELIVRKKDQNKNLMFIIFFIALNILSFFIIIQPSFEAPHVGKYEVIFDVETAYIIQVSENEYQLFSNKQYIDILSKDEVIELKKEGFRIYQ